MHHDTILITGSNGFIGQNLVHSARDTYRVVAVDRTAPPDVPWPGVEHVHCNLATAEGVATLTAELTRRDITNIAAVVHLAADFEIRPSGAEESESASLEQLHQLLGGLQRFMVGQFIFASTMLVHAPGRPGMRINESSPVKPQWGFPQMKLAAEQLLLRERGGLRVVNLRLAAVYDDRCHAVPLAQQIARIRDKRITARHFPGNPQHGQAYMHVDDLTEAILRVIERRLMLPADTTLLLGEPETASYDTLQRVIGWLVHGREWKTHRVSKRFAETALWLQYHVADMDPFIKPWMLKVADHHYELDISRARQLLDWNPRHTVLTTLPRMIEHLRVDPDGWERDNRLSA